MDQCPKCGGSMIGDGYTTVLHCENADEPTYEFLEPDAGPVYCDFKEEPTMSNEIIANTGGVGHPDSTGKLLHQIACLALEPVALDGKVLNPTLPSKIVIGASMFRNFVCPEGCKACCLRITLDYTPEEYAKFNRSMDGFNERKINVNGKDFSIHTCDQRVRSADCMYLNHTARNGCPGCGLWPSVPLSCESAPQIQIRMVRGNSYILKCPFSRAWAFALKPQCTFTAYTVTDAPILVRERQLLWRFNHWATYLGIPTVIPAAIKFLDSYQIGNPIKPYVIWEKDHAAVKQPSFI